MGKTVSQDNQNNCVAIVGMGCVFPKANGIDEYWQLLFNEEDAITDIPEETHFAIKDYYDKDPKCPDHIYCKRGGFIPAVSFDPSQYGIPPNNINATDTSQLLGLVVAEMALKDAGYDVKNNFPNKKRTNIILGVTGTQELVIPLGARLGHPLWKNALKNSGIGADKSDEVIKRIQNGYPEWQENSFPGLLGNVVAGRIANKLDLGGTNSVVDAACASSLSAINSAVMELVQGKCDMSITGGVDALNDIFMHMCFSQTGVLSHTSDARPFSKDSDGTVLGEGVGMIVLKRLKDAKKDKDRIYAVIKGIGTSSDGNSGGIYAPDAKGQQRALKAAYKEAAVDPSTVESIEAHGTGTRVGDKIEFQALKTFRASSSSDNGKCAIGSVKSMIGHAKAAAGIAGLIKTALSLYHKTHFPTLKADTPDPELDINNSPFYLNSHSKPWIKQNHKKNNYPRRAGVSAFGFGGSNFHAVLEEYNPVKEHVSWSKSVQILAFSSNSSQDLKENIKNLITDLYDDQKLDSKGKRDQLAFFASQSRDNFSNQHELRLLIVVEKDGNPVELLEKAIKIIIDNIQNNEAPTNDRNIYFKSESLETKNQDCKVGFLFPGQGSQYTMMGKDLVSIFPEANEAVGLASHCFEKDSKSKPLHDYIFPLPEHVQDTKSAEEALRNTDIAQPALGAISLAMLKILKRFSISPTAACGHSFGELCALNAAGRINDNDLLKLAAARGKHMAKASKQSGDSGSMFAIKASMDKIEQIIAENKLDLVLANRNSYSQGVLSGSTDEIDRAVKIFKKNKVRGVKLPVAAAFHSHLVENAAKPFAEDLKDINFNETDIPVMSNTTGTPYPSDSKEAKDILGKQLSNPVNFIKNIESMYESGISLFLEIGPKTVLTGLVKSILKGKNVTAVSMDISAGKKAKPDSGLSDLAHVLANLASKGCNIDLTKWENPCDKIEKKKMNVFLNGANPKPVAKYDLPPSKAMNTNQDKIQKDTTDPFQGKNMHKKTIADKKDTSIETARKPKIANEAIALIQKGLESMQKLQSQTAKTHEKFLETQAEASRTLQSMMAQTRLFTDNITPLPYPDTTTTPVTRDMMAPEPVIDPEPANEGRNVQAKENIAANTEEQRNKDLQTFSVDKTEIEAVNTDTDEKTESLVFEIVSKLTGFPEEMLESDMDIESDLGIDSIKRVEIISELEKSLPSVSSLTPESMGSLRTLKEICDIIDSSNNSIPEPVGSNPGVTDNKISQNTAQNTDQNQQSMDVLIKTISDLTGFPKEMLEGDMDLESDLGIDSIKRVEILSTLEKELPQIGTLSSDEIAGFKTINEISSYLDKSLGQITEQIPDQETNQEQNEQSLSVTTPSDKKKTLKAATDPIIPTQRLLRQIPFLEQHPIDKVKFYNGSRLSISKTKKVYLTKDTAGIAQSFQKEFEKQGINAVLIELSNTEIPELTDAAGIVVIPDISDSKQTESFLKTAFKLVKKNVSYLTESASQKSAFFATISFLGGSFGFDKKEIVNPVQGGLAGLAKTASLEWKDILCKAIDMPCSLEKIIENAENAVTLMMTHGSVETGISNGVCNIPKLKLEEIPLFEEYGLTEDLTAKNEVFVITGGAKGVTAECAIELANAFSPKIMLIGRSENPSMEPDWIQGVTSEPEIKKSILKNQFAGKTPKPVELEKAFRKLMSNREIKETINKIQAAGSVVEYFSCDIRKKNEVSILFDNIRKKQGKITGIIHGAGILEDKLIVEKDYDKFCKVFDTKVSGMNSLIEASKKDNLKYFIGFSSVAARTGNVGQSDYSMANEVLNKTLQKLSIENSGCKYLSMNWGPWDGGMVNQSLKKEFHKRNVDLIDKKAGAYQLLSEMKNNKATNVEIVIGASLFGKEAKPKPSLTKAFNYNFNGSSAPVLDSHKINNNMVVPFAVHMEWLAHAAEKNNPGLYLSGIDQMRLLKGISFQDDSIEIIAKTNKCKKAEQGFETEVSVFSTKNDEKTFLNSAGTALIEDSLPDAPVLSASSSLDLVPFSLSVDEIYQSVLFHGKDLQAIKSITGCSTKGIEVSACRAPLPDIWFKNPPARNWIFDPMLLDAAFQAAILWTWENKKQVCLPSYVTNFRLYNSFEKSEGDVRIRFTVNETSKHKIRGYFTFIDSNNKIIASITGFEAINDPSLLGRFKKTEELISREQILAFAEGNPSEAFGEKYKIFDNEKQMARLPRPPYFFMDRVTKIDHTQWEMKSGGWIEAEFDVPDDGWYFNANHSDTIPFCILLEIALQPCGWLAAWAGSALKSNDRLYFRNLGGKAQIFKNVTRKSGTIIMRSRMTDVSQAGGMIIQDFDIEVLKKDEYLYQGSTNFGFFTSQSLSNQIGIKNNKFHIYEIDTALLDDSKKIIFQDNAPLTPNDLNIDKNNGMPSTALRMIDKIEQFSLKGGLYNKGYIKATKKVNPDEWFFNAHFYQDPVCPGSLGIESFLQVLRFYALQKWQFSPESFKIEETINASHEWKYRGQIIPSNKQIEICAHIKDVIDGDQPQIIADGALSVDGICIYEMIDFNVTLTENNSLELIEGQEQEQAER
jgi:acyl transferase domain-containing protein/3-hydroxymyristoyl/3-hydroxydecanoyl-(acyl carrier protein) dehydratase/NAD(P)-dependent dehydrogenase (short-subunit alcohol dehydrogenase family)